MNSHFLHYLVSIIATHCSFCIPHFSVVRRPTSFPPPCMCAGAVIAPGLYLDCPCTGFISEEEQSVPGTVGHFSRCSGYQGRPFRRCYLERFGLGLDPSKDFDAKARQW